MAQPHELTHFDAAGQAHMVDVSGKAVTHRVARASGCITMKPETFARVTAPAAHADPVDQVLGVPSFFSLGFLRPGPAVAFGSSPRAFGAPGAGGSFGFADPDARLGYAYVMNRLDFHLVDDPREKPLRDAIHRAIASAG